MNYTHRFVPPEMFELNNLSQELLRRLEDLTGSTFNILTYTEEIVSFIAEVIADPEHLVLEQLPIWYSQYRDLWQPVLTWYFKHKDYESFKIIYESYVLIAKTMVRDGFKDRMGKQAAHALAAQHIDAIESPWILLFIKWHVSGRKEYVVSSGLAQRLQQTVLKGYPCSQLKLPYESFWLDLRNWDEFGDRGKLEGALVHYLWDEPTKSNTYDKLQIAIASPPDSPSEFPRVIHIDLAQDTLEHALEDALQRNSAYQPYSKDWEALFRYIVNVILYATMPDCEAEFTLWDPQYKKLKNRLLKLPKGSPKRKKINAQLKHKNPSGYIKLGGSISVDRNLNKSPSSKNDGSRTLSVRSLVSGHWRDQPCGPQRSERKRIWIEPFWRGPELAPITQKSHKLK